MRLPTFVLTVCAGLVLAAEAEPNLSSSAKVYIQSIGSSYVSLLTEIQYDATTLDAEIASYEPPELPEHSEFVRVGLYDSSKKKWLSSTTATSPESFAKGYAPIVVLSLDANGGVLSVAVQSSKIDAGQTRDFGPKVKVVGVIKGKLPELNRPVVLKDGKVEEKPAEKTMLQKYWWVGAAGLLLLVTSGGDGK